MKNRDPRLEFKEDVDAKILLHEIRMTERVENDVEELTVEMFNKAMKTVWQKKGEKYDFLIKGGYDLKNAIFSLFKKVWNEETIPRRWTETTLLQLFKMKGNFQELPNLRNIHLKDTTAKLFFDIDVEIAKKVLMENVSPFQIGVKKGHRASEHIYLIKSVMQITLGCRYELPSKLQMFHA